MSKPDSKPQVARVAREVAYSLTETFSGIHHRIVVTFAVVAAVAVSLTLLGGAWLLQSQIALLAGDWYEKIEIGIYLCNDNDPCEVPSQEQLTLLETALKGDERIREVAYESQQDAYANFVAMFADQPELIAATPPEALPASFRIRLVDPDLLTAVSDDYKHADGVSSVVDQRDLLEKVFPVMDGVKRGALGIAAIQLLAALVLIHNAVRISASSRREQTQIMKHLGASDRYIRTPFIIEATLLSALGAACSWLVLASTAPKLVAAAHRVLKAPYIGPGEVTQTGAGLVVVASVLAMATAWLALRKHLRV